MRYSLKLRDFLKGALLAIITPVLYVIQDSIQRGELTLNWKNIIMTAIGGFVAYLIKNFFTDEVKVAQKIIEKHEEKQAEKVSDAKEIVKEAEKTEGDDGSKPPEEERPDKP